MSKAFTREVDDLPDQPVLSRHPSLPPGARNYITQDGFVRLHDELEHLMKVERPGLTLDPEDPVLKSRLQAIDRRILYLQRSLESAEVVPSPSSREDRVRFGATVTVRNQRGEQSQYRIVGVDEMDIDRGWVSWLSPIAKALLNAGEGQKVRFKFPSGEEQLEILKVEY